MPAMEKQALIKDLTHYLTQETACKETLACLSDNAELAIRIAGSVELNVTHKGDEVFVQERQALAPDFIFNASPDAIAVLISEKNLSVGQLGVKFAKQIVSRDVQVSMPTSIFQITRKGYFKIVQVGGIEFFNEMKKHNLASLPRLMAALKKLRKSGH